MAAVRWCREAVQLSRVAHYSFLFRRPPRHAGTVRPRLPSKMVWTLKRPEPCVAEGLDPDDPR
jgi:hypothetical protein